MLYQTFIKGVKETEEGTDLLLHIPNTFIKDKLFKIKQFIAELRINDNRTITNEQRKMIYATIKDISLYSGHDPEYLKEQFKFDYCGEANERYFSLGNCSIDIARGFINYLIDFILKHNIPLTDLALNRTEDIDKYLYFCIKYRRCAITGRANANIHHVEGSRVGMGGDRTKVDNTKRFLIALSPEWHNKVHAEGEDEIFKLYKVYGILVDSNTLKVLKLSHGDIT